MSLLDIVGKLVRNGAKHALRNFLRKFLIAGVGAQIRVNARRPIFNHNAPRIGVALGGAFFGESMFTRRELGGTNASKVCLLALDAKLARGGFTLLDSQETNPHLEQFGGFEITFDEYAVALAQSIQVVATW